MELTQLYRSLLTMTAFQAGEDGTMYAKVDGLEVPITIEGKGLTLPTPTALRNAFARNQVIFHPLNENAAATDKPVFKRYLAGVMADLNAYIADYVVCLANLAATPENQSNLPQEALEVLTTIGPVDKAFYQKLMLIAAEVQNSDDVNVSWIKIYMKRNGKVAGKVGKQAAIVSFPILEKIDEDEICNLKIRKKDREPFKQIFKQVLSHCFEAEWYNHVSDSQTCPSMDALMGSVKKIYESILDFTSKMPKTVADLEFSYPDVNMDWVDAFNNIEAMRTKIIVVPATTVAPEAPPPAPVAAPAVMQAPGLPIMQQGYQPPIAAPAAPAGTFSALMQNNPQMAQQLAYQAGYMGLGQPGVQTPVVNPIANGFNNQSPNRFDPRNQNQPHQNQTWGGGNRGF